MYVCMYACMYVCIEIIENVYDNSSFQVKTKTAITAEIPRSRGIIQGCPYSIIAFQQGIDDWLRWIDCDYNQLHRPIPVQGYVDDLALVASSEDEIQVMMEKTDTFLSHTGMQAKHRKYALLHGQRTSDAWSKNSTTENTVLTIQDQQIPVFNKDNSYKYLGHDIQIDNRLDLHY